LARPVPRQRSRLEQRRLPARLRREAGRQDVPAARTASSHLVSWRGYGDTEIRGCGTANGLGRRLLPEAVSSRIPVSPYPRIPVSPYPLIPVSPLLHLISPDL